MKKLLTVTTLLSLAIISLPVQSLVSAQQTETETSTSSAEEQIQENLKNRIQRVVEEKRDQVQGIMSDNLQKRGFVGVVQRVSEEALNLETPNGTVILALSEQVNLVQANQPVEISDIEIENEVIVLGYQDGDEFEPRRLIVSEETLRPVERTITIGNIQEVTRNSVTILPRNSETPAVYSFNNTSTFNDNQGEEIEASELEEELEVVLISVAENENNRAVRDSVGRVKLLQLLEPIAEN